MACKPICSLCPRLVISQAVTYGGGVLTINLPAGNYENCQKYCIVIAQAIPDTAVIGAPVVITIGTGATEYPLVKRNCALVTACGIRTRTRYSVVVSTEAASTGRAVFKLLGKPCCSPDNSAPSIDGGDAPVPVALVNNPAGKGGAAK